MRRPSCGRFCSSSADCQPLARQPQVSASHSPSTLVAAIAISALARRHEDPARPRFAWGMRNFDTRLERGFIDAAAFVRTHAARAIPLPSFRRTRRAGWTTMRRGWPRWLVCRPTWRGRAFRPATARHAAWSSSSGCPSCTASKRPATRTPPLRHSGRAGVDFLVTLGDRGPSFDPSGSRAAFRAAGAAVYQIGPR